VSPRRLLRSLAVALVLVLWLLYWSLNLRGAQAGVGFLLTLVLVVALANVLAPRLESRPWTRNQLWGAVLAFLGCGILAAGNVARFQHYDPPVLDWEQVAPWSWLLAAVLLLAATWSLLGDPGVDAASPRCGQCGTRVQGDRCVKCGLAFA